MENPLTIKLAQEIASEWHSGQNSAFYSFASTGKYLPEKQDEYLKEVETCLNEAKDNLQRLRLKSFKTFFQLEKIFVEMEELGL